MPDLNPAQPTRSNPASSDPAAFDDGCLGVYIHLPYCERICPYCDFAVLAARPLEPDDEARMVAGLLTELDRRRADFPDRGLASLYFGGGTPSLFEAASIEALRVAVEEAFSPVAGASVDADGAEPERTLELNPSTVECGRLPGFRNAGINRLSIGIQSFQDRILKTLGRAHRAETARETLRAARAAGFDNLSLDLIFACPDQDRAELDLDLDEMLRWSPEHISTYELTWEPQTPFGQALAAGKMARCDDDLAADMMEHVESRLCAEGYERYEISSYARPGYRARHNKRYWQRQAVLGLGMGAHSSEARSDVHPHGARRANPRELEEWRAPLERDTGTPGDLEPLPAEVSRGEAVFLALRQREGLAAVRFAAEFGAPPRDFFADPIDRMRARGWLEEGGVDEEGPAAMAPGDLRLTPSGRLVADSVAAEFLGLEHD